MSAQSTLQDLIALIARAPDLIRRSTDAIALYDLDGRLVYGNRAALAIVGAPATETLIGRHFNDHMTLKEATAASRAFAHVATTGESVSFESEFQDAQGEAVPVSGRLIAARIDGNVVGVFGIAHDMSTQRTIEAQFSRAEQQFRSLFEHHPDMIALCDRDGKYIRINAAAERIIGYGAEELIGKTRVVLTGESEVAVFREQVDAALRGETSAFSATVTTKSGDVRIVDGRVVPVIVDGVVEGYFSLSRDVTEARAHERELARQGARISELYRIAAASTMTPREQIERALAIGLNELHCDWAYVATIENDTFHLNFSIGAPPFAGIGELPLDTTLVRHAIANDELLVIADTTQPPWNDDASGRAEVWRGFVGIPLHFEDGGLGAMGFAKTGAGLAVSALDRNYIRGIAALAASAMQRETYEQRLSSLAFHDPLTQLPNRSLFNDRLVQAILTARRHKRSFALHYIDVDHFKAVNDTHGHGAGDAYLVAIGTWLRKMLRDSDTLARLGGDEFVILQPEITERRQAEELAARLGAIRRYPIEVEGARLSITLSIGTAIFPHDGTTGDELLAAADASLYAVKEHGRDGYQISTSGDESSRQTH